MKFVKHYEKGYTTVGNEVLRDKNLSNAAKGLFVFLWSCSDEFHITARGLEAVCKDSYDAIRRQLKELVSAGYLRKTQEKENGRFSNARYDLRDSKDTPFDDAPEHGTPWTGLPSTVKAADKEILIEEILNKETTASNSSSHSTVLGEKPEKEEEKRRESKKYFQIPIYDEVAMYVKEHGYQMDASDFFEFYEKRNWQANGRPMRDWRKCCDVWERQHQAEAQFDEMQKRVCDLLFGGFDFEGAMRRERDSEEDS